MQILIKQKKNKKKVSDKVSFAIYWVHFSLVNGPQQEIVVCASENAFFCYFLQKR